MVSMLVFTTSLVGVIAMMTNASLTGALGRKEVRASAVTTDMVSQIALWAYDDARLTPNNSGICDTDPTDDARLFERDFAAARAAYEACAYDDSDLYTGGWTGLGPVDPTTGALSGAAGPVTFPTGDSGRDEFRRYFIVREEDRNGSPPATAGEGARKRIWTIVAFRSSGVTGSYGHKVVNVVTKVIPRFQ
jgi:hypothetical protein